MEILNLTQQCGVQLVGFMLGLACFLVEKERQVDVKAEVDLRLDLIFLLTDFVEEGVIEQFFSRWAQVRVELQHKAEYLQELRFI